MSTLLRPLFVLFVMLTVVTGLIYPLLVTGIGKALFPEISYFTLYAPMVLILAVKPTGLFGRE